jgi:tetratricopeptide (TPR) repeat protein
MRRLVVLLAATSLAICATPYARAEANLDLPKTMDALDVAKTAELKGDLARVHKEYGEAIFQYQKVLRADPKNVTVWNKMGIAELKLKNKSAARKDFQKALKYDPRSVSALNNLGAVAYLDKKYKSSIQYLKRALELDETSAPSHLNMAEAWVGLGEIDRAMIEYARAIELDADILSEGQGGITAQVTTPEQRARVSYLIAKAYAKRGNIDGALEYLRRARDGHYFDLGRVYKDQEFAVLWPDPRLEKIVKR